MIWEDYCRQYLLGLQTAGNITECEELQKALSSEVVKAFAQLTDADEQWFKDALVDSEPKRFVLFVLYESLQVPSFLFESLLRSAIHEVDPSYNGRFIEPALVAFGWRRVNEHLLEYVERGSDFEKAGAVNALYWSAIPYVNWSAIPYVNWSAIPYVNWGGDHVGLTEDIADLRAKKRQLFLKEFVQNPDVQVRRSIIPQLNLDQSTYRGEFAALVSKAIEIARTHPDDYIRHRLQVQLGQENIFRPLPHRKHK